jgi:hypothetical protein
MARVRGAGLGLGWAGEEADGEQRWVMIVVVGCSGGDGWMLMGWVGEERVGGQVVVARQQRVP